MTWRCMPQGGYPGLKYRPPSGECRALKGLHIIAQGRRSATLGEYVKRRFSPERGLQHAPIGLKSTTLPTRGGSNDYFHAVS